QQDSDQARDHGDHHDEPQTDEHRRNSEQTELRAAPRCPEVLLQSCLLPYFDVHRVLRESLAVRTPVSRRAPLSTVCPQPESGVYLPPPPARIRARRTSGRAASAWGCPPAAP